MIKAAGGPSRMMRAGIAALFGTALMVAGATPAAAASFYFCPTGTNTCGAANAPVPGTGDLQDLDHYKMYTWRIAPTGMNLGTTAGTNYITGAQLFIDNIRNWDTNPAQLFIHLLDSPKNPSGLSSTYQVNANVGVYTDTSGTATIDDNFKDATKLGYTTLVNSGSANILLASPTAYFPSPAVNSFTTSASDYYLNVDPTLLTAYIGNGGDFALAFDPDCHFFNDGLRFEITTAANPNTPVPEPASLMLLGLGLAGLAAHRRRAASRPRTHTAPAA